MRWPMLLSLSVLRLVAGCTGSGAREAALEGRPPQQAAGTPKYVCAGLATHMYMELSRGKRPLEMLDATVQIGFSAKGFPRVQEIPLDEVDFAPVMAWVKENPISLVSDVHLPLSQPGYQRVDLPLTNDFYVSVICQQYRIQRFLILDHEPGQT